MADETPLGARDILHDRVRQIAIDTALPLEHVLFMVGLQSDDMMLRLDPSFPRRHSAFLKAMTPPAKYWALKKAVAELLAEINEFGLASALPAWEMDPDDGQG